MAAKQLAFSDDARMRLKEGIDILAKAVATPLGPKGRKGIFQNPMRRSGRSC